MEEPKIHAASAATHIRLPNEVTCGMRDSPFQTLPPELRNEIWKYVFDDIWQTTTLRPFARKPLRNGGHVRLALLVTCKRINQEAAGYAWSEVHASIGRARRENRPQIIDLTVEEADYEPVSVRLAQIGRRLSIVVELECHEAAVLLGALTHDGLVGQGPEYVQASAISTLLPRMTGLNHATVWDTYLCAKQGFFLAATKRIGSPKQFVQQLAAFRGLLGSVTTLELVSRRRGDDAIVWRIDEHGRFEHIASGQILETGGGEIGDEALTGLCSSLRFTRRSPSNFSNSMAEPHLSSEGDSRDHYSDGEDPSTSRCGLRHSPLNTLPSELRNEIWEFVFEGMWEHLALRLFHKPSQLNTTTSSAQSSLGLLLTCKRINHEAQGLAWRDVPAVVGEWQTVKEHMREYAPTRRSLFDTPEHKDLARDEAETLFKTMLSEVGSRLHAITSLDIPREGILRPLPSQAHGSHSAMVLAHATSLLLPHLSDLRRISTVDTALYVIMVSAKPMDAVVASIDRDRLPQARTQLARLHVLLPHIVKLETWNPFRFEGGLAPKPEPTTWSISGNRLENLESGAVWDIEAEVAEEAKGQAWK